MCMETFGSPFYDVTVVVTVRGSFFCGDFTMLEWILNGGEVPEKFGLYEVYQTLPDITNQIDAVECSSDGSVVVLGSSVANTVTVLNLTPNGYETVQTLTGSARRSLGATVSLTSDGTQLLVSDKTDLFLYVKGEGGYVIQHTFPGFTGGGISPTGDVVVGLIFSHTAADRGCYIHEHIDGTWTQVLTQRIEYAGGARFSPDGRTLIVLNHSNLIIYPLRKSNGVWEKYPYITGGPDASPGNTRLIYGYTAALFENYEDLNKRVPIPMPGDYRKAGKWESDYGMTAGEDRVALSDVYRTKITIYQEGVEGFSNLQTLNGTHRCFAMSQDGKYILACTDRTMTVYKYN